MRRVAYGRESANWQIEFIISWIAGLVVVGIVLAIVVGAILMAGSGKAHARDGGQYAQSPLKSWFDHLRSSKGLCCSFADGIAIQDVDWDTDGTHYRVRIEGVWVVVPDDAVITEPNRFGPAVVWPYWLSTGIAIRCFMPGAGT